jgi:hypothetical protein
MTNVSMSGAFIESHLPARLFSSVQVRFSGLQHGRRMRLTVEAQIVRKGQSGFGIEWQEIDLHAIRALANRPIEVPPRAPGRKPSASAALLSLNRDSDH